MTAFSYLLNMGGTQKKYLTDISKEIWGYLIERNIHLTADCILSNPETSRTATNGNFAQLFSNKFAVI